LKYWLERRGVAHRSSTRKKRERELSVDSAATAGLTKIKRDARSRQLFCFSVAPPVFNACPPGSTVDTQARAQAARWRLAVDIRFHPGSLNFSLHF